MSDSFTPPAWGPAPAPSFTPATSPAPPPPPRAVQQPRTRLWIALGGGLAAVLALVAVLGFWIPGFFVSTVYDSAGLQSGVLNVLRNQYQLGADAVACPANVPVSAGLQFSCNALIGGQQRQVSIRVLSGDGRFEVARPA